ncbi:hypothetical protein PR048_016596 [Dryococelus australis]|uniref:carbonic anhydrase n=1 Tax=Dryococelus australis TaxID=614101 RepID=A0ABQ9H7M3_9NEOP|nr:hypothetical protein PR048_016596 [Dryococelus australis]
MDPCYFQDDNARCHVSRATMQWYTNNNVRRLDWATQSPDLDPIEHLWDALDRRVYGSDNEVYSEIVAYLPKVSAPGSTVQLLRPVTLESLLPQNKHLYFTYHGSLTTPPCSEIVIWIDFKQPILLSHRQSPQGKRPTATGMDRRFTQGQGREMKMNTTVQRYYQRLPVGVAAFRRMQSDHGRLTQNFRPIQPLSGRLIQFNVADDMSSASVPGRHFSQAACLSFALFLCILLWR